MIDCLTTECPAISARTALAAKLFRGLADPTRLTILQALRGGPKRVVDLTKLTGKAQPNVSAHIACLRDCGLIKATPTGRETYYALVDNGMREVLEATERILRRVGPKLCACQWYAEQIP